MGDGGQWMRRYREVGRSTYGGWMRFLSRWGEEVANARLVRGDREILLRVRTAFICAI